MLKMLLASSAKRVFACISVLVSIRHLLLLRVMLLLAISGETVTLCPVLSVTEDRQKLAN